MSFPKLSWGREKHDLADRWPKGPDGTPENPPSLSTRPRRTTPRA